MLLPDRGGYQLRCMVPGSPLERKNPVRLGSMTLQTKRQAES